MFSLCFLLFSKRFPGLTYWQDAQGKFLFSAFFCFRKIVQEIFSDWADNLRGVFIHRDGDWIQRREPGEVPTYKATPRRGPGPTRASWSPGGPGSPRHRLFAYKLSLALKTSGEEKFSTKQIQRRRQLESLGLLESYSGTLSKRGLSLETKQSNNWKQETRMRTIR